MAIGVPSLYEEVGVLVNSGVLLFETGAKGSGPIVPVAEFQATDGPQVVFANSLVTSNERTVAFDAFVGRPMSIVPSSWRRHRPRQPFGDMAAAATAAAAPATYIHEC